MKCQRNCFGRDVHKRLAVRGLARLDSVAITTRPPFGDTCRLITPQFSAWDKMDPSPAIPFKAQIITHLFAEREHDGGSGIHAINPVDESDAFKELCEACRRFALGTSEAVRELKLILHCLEEEM